MHWFVNPGAYYYYHTEPNKTYTDTMLDVVKYAKMSGIPYGYVQYDSWWYYKGKGDGTVNWTAMPSVFPNGMKYIFFPFLFIFFFTNFGHVKCSLVNKLLFFCNCSAFFCYVNTESMYRGTRKCVGEPQEGRGHFTLLKKFATFVYHHCTGDHIDGCPSVDFYYTRWVEVIPILSLLNTRWLRHFFRAKTCKGRPVFNQECWSRKIVRMIVEICDRVDLVLRS